MAMDPAFYKKTVDEATDLPSLPTVIAEITEKIRNPTTSANEVAHLIQEDQALTSNVLKLVNSAFYGFPKQVNSITRAIVILGFNKVRNLALSSSVIDAFKGRSLAFDFVKFWQHCMGTAIASDVLAKQLGIKEVDDAFTAGLLHDIGKLVISVSFPRDMDAIVTKVLGGNVLMREAEQEVMEIDHTRVGYWLSQRWGMPAVLVNTIRFHHQPLNARENAPLVHVVHIADAVARTLGIGSGGDELVPEISKDVWDKFGLGASFLDKTMEQTLQGVEKAQAFFELIKGGR